MQLWKLRWKFLLNFSGISSKEFIWEFLWKYCSKFMWKSIRKVPGNSPGYPLESFLQIPLEIPSGNFAGNCRRISQKMYLWTHQRILLEISQEIDYLMWISLENFLKNSAGHFFGNSSVNSSGYFSGNYFEKPLWEILSKPEFRWSSLEIQQNMHLVVSLENLSEI